MQKNKSIALLFTLFGIIFSVNSQQMHPDTPKIVIAHRGASGYLPEHTLEAKAMAYAMGADYLEQDLVLSKDDVPVVIHDIYLDDITDVAKKFPGRARKDGRFYVIDFTYDELRTLNVSERFDRKTGKAVFPGRFPVGKSHFSLHSLQDEIELIQGLNKSTGKNPGIYPEIKNPSFHRENGKDISAIVLKILNDYGYRSKSDRCILQCFDAAELKRIRTELKSELTLAQLIEIPGQEELLTEYATYADIIGIWVKLLVSGYDANGKPVFTDTISKQAHAAGLQVHAFTLRADQIAEMNSFDQLLQEVLYNADTDGVFTDFPDKVKDFLNKK